MLQLHVPTLLAVSLVVNLTLSSFCLTCWYGRPDRQIYVWLCLASATSMAGTICLMMRGAPPEWVTVWLAQSLLLISNGLVWTGIRVFEKRPIRIIWIFAGAIVWTVFCLIPPLYTEVSYRVICIPSLMAAYFVCITWEIIQGYRLELTRSRVVVCVVCVLHVIALLSRISLIYNVNTVNWPVDTASTWIGIFVIESIVSIVAIVLALTTMERDRAEMEQRKAASTDVLTGALNRRAFISNSTDWIERQGKDAALLLFDLDHFKKINDTFGHAGGDMALIAFAKLVSRRIEIANIIAGFNLDASTSNQYPRWYETTLADAAEGGEPIFGRLGGEEFACLLPHLSLVQGLVIAEDIRTELAAMHITVAGHRVPLSVSASVVTTADIGHRLDMMLSSADHALYRAKDMGRNRVEAGLAESSEMLIRRIASAVNA